MEEIVSKSAGGEITISTADFSALISDAKKITIDYVPYSEITRIIYAVNVDGLDMLFNEFSDKIVEDINENVSDNQEVKSYHNYLIKTLEHMKLASKQITSLYRDQEKSIAKQKETIAAQTSA